MGIGDWGLGIGDWGLGGWGLGVGPNPPPPTPPPPPPKPHPPTPNPHFKILFLYFYKLYSIKNKYIWNYININIFNKFKLILEIAPNSLSNKALRIYYFIIFPTNIII